MVTRKKMMGRRGLRVAARQRHPLGWWTKRARRTRERAKRETRRVAQTGAKRSSRIFCVYLPETKRWDWQLLYSSWISYPGTPYPYPYPCPYPRALTLSNPWQWESGKTWVKTLNSWKGTPCLELERTLFHFHFPLGYCTLHTLENTTLILIHLAVYVCVLGGGARVCVYICCCGD